MTMVDLNIIHQIANMIVWYDSSYENVYCQGAQDLVSHVYQEPIVRSIVPSIVPFECEDQLQPFCPQCMVQCRYITQYFPIVIRHVLYPWFVHAKQGCVSDLILDYCAHYAQLDNRRKIELKMFSPGLFYQNHNGRGPQVKSKTNRSHTC